MKHVLFLALAVLAVAAAGDNQAIDEVVVVATRDARSTFKLPYSTSVIKRDDMERTLTRSLPQAFRNTPGIMVQETSFGQGSPFIRGFTGFRNLFLIDGIRMNNAIMRDGPNQYWATVDLYGLDRIEVVSGPASTLYGSDAIGGTVNALTPDPFDARSRMLTRISSAEGSVISRLEYRSDIGERSAVWLGATGKHFGDLEGGSDTGTQTGVGYDEYAADLKWSSHLRDGWRLDALAQHVRQNNVPRTHRTVHAKSWRGTSVGKDLKWELDQTRRFAYVRASNPAMVGPIQAATFTVSAARMEEVRDRIRSSGVRELSGFDVVSYGASAQLSSSTGIGSLIYGLDFFGDRVDSFSGRNPIQGSVADDATYQSVDLFLQDRVALSSRAELIIGIRHTRTAMDARSVMDPVTGERIRIEAHWTATVANLRAHYELVPDRVVLFAGVAEALRAPNLSDMTRFDSGRTNELEIPALDLQPEMFLSLEAGIRWRGRYAHLSAAYFHTRIDGLIQRIPTGRIVAEETEITKANIGDGWVTGVELSAERGGDGNFTVFGTLTWMNGEVDTFPTSDPIVVRETIDRLMPLTASLGVRWHADHSPLWVEAVIYSADNQDSLSTRDMADTSRIPPGGTPGYGVLHVRAGYRFNDNVRIIFAVDNIGNIDYRSHGSGTNMPGRNVLLSVELEL